MEMKCSFFLLKETQRSWRKINLLDRFGKESSLLVSGLCPSSLPYRDRQDNLADILTDEWDNIFMNVQVTEELNV